MELIRSKMFEPYENQPPHMQRFWTIVEDFLKRDVVPVPSIINRALGRGSRHNLNGRESAVRIYLLEKYGYTYSDEKRRWIKA